MEYCFPNKPSRLGGVAVEPKGDGVEEEPNAGAATAGVVLEPKADGVVLAAAVVAEPKAGVAVVEPKIDDLVEGKGGFGPEKELI